MFTMLRPRLHGLNVLVGTTGMVGIVALSGHWRCPFATVFGIPCAGCGATRALVLLGRGRLHESLRLHPLAVPASLLCVVTLALWTRTPDRSAPIVPRAMLWAWYFVVAALVGLWLGRFAGWFGGPVPLQ